MATTLSANAVQFYRENGYYFPIRAFTVEQAAEFRRRHRSPPKDVPRGIVFENFTFADGARRIGACCDRTSALGAGPVIGLDNTVVV